MDLSVEKDKCFVFFSVGMYVCILLTASAVKEQQKDVCATSP